MKRGSISGRYHPALAAIVVGLAGGLIGGGPESWAQAPRKPATVGGQAAPVAVKVEGEVSTPLRLTAAELKQFPRQTVVARAHDGKESRFEGVALLRCPQESRPADWQ